MQQVSFSDTARIEEAFRRLDLDGSGELTVDDLTSLLGDSYSPDLIKSILSEADYGEQDGKIDLAEFKRAIMGAPVSGTMV